MVASPSESPSSLLLAKEDIVPEVCTGQLCRARLIVHGPFGQGRTIHRVLTYYICDLLDEV